MKWVYRANGGARVRGQFRRGSARIRRGEQARERILQRIRVRALLPEADQVVGQQMTQLAVLHGRARLGTQHPDLH
jgi:hypothetical protein